MGVYVPVVSYFRKSKNVVTKNREFPFTKHSTIASPPIIPKVIWRSRTYRRKTNSFIATIDISKSMRAQFQISSFTPSYRTRKLIEHPTYVHYFLNNACCTVYSHMLYTVQSLLFWHSDSAWRGTLPSMEVKTESTHGVNRCGSPECCWWTLWVKGICSKITMREFLKLL